MYTVLVIALCISTFKTLALAPNFKLHVFDALLSCEREVNFLRQETSVLRSQFGGGTCSKLLVSGKSGITDSAITASTVYNNVFCRKENSRICSTGEKYGGWCAGTSNINQWLQFDFGKPVTITGVVTVGRYDAGQWVKEYKLFYGNDLSTLVQYKTDTGKSILTGNSDTRSFVQYWLDKLVVGRYVRIVPTKWKDHITMRADILGCRDGACQACLKSKKPFCA